MQTSVQSWNLPSSGIEQLKVGILKLWKLKLWKLPPVLELLKSLAQFWNYVEHKVGTCLYGFLLEYIYMSCDQICNIVHDDEHYSFAVTEEEKPFGSFASLFQGSL